MISGIALFVGSYFMNFSLFLVEIVILFQFLGGFMFYIYGKRSLDPKKAHSHIHFEQSKVFYYFFFAMMLFFMILYAKSGYRVKNGYTLSSFEQSQVNSILFGINQRRNRILATNNCDFYGHGSKLSSYHLHFVAACMIEDPTSHNVRFLIYLLNSLSTCVFMSYFLRRFTNHFYLVTFLVFMNNGWSSFRYFFQKTDLEDVDYINHTPKDFFIPAYHFISHYLLSSFSTSFSIPMLLLSVGVAQASCKKNRPTIFAYLIAVTIPIPYISIITISLLLIIQEFNSLSLIFLVAPFRLYGSSIQFKPIWNYYHTKGVLFSEFSLLFDILGPIFFALPFFTYWGISHDVLMRYILFLLVSITIISGNDSFISYSVTSSLCLPVFISGFSNMIIIYYKNIKNKSLKGIIIAFLSFMLILNIFGGFITFFESFSQIPLFKHEDIEFSDSIMHIIPPSSLVYTPVLDNNPVSNLAGKQVLLSNIEGLWRIGYSPSQTFRDIEKMNLSFLINEYPISYLVQYDEMPKVDVLLEPILSIGKWALNRIK